MSIADELARNNDAWASREFPGARSLAPARELAIVACMDSRMDLYALLGLAAGDAHVIRNAGGVVTDDVVRSLVISQRLLGTHRVVLVHHTDCGLMKITEDEFRHELELECGVRPPFAIEAFRDPYSDVRQSMNRLRLSPFLPHKDEIWGFVYDVADGRLSPVEP